MSYQRAADIITYKIRSACSTDEQRESLERLCEKHPFWVTDLKGVAADDGTPAVGLCALDEGGRIYLSPSLVGYSDCSALIAYLHEACHAGAFSGGQPISSHSKRFNSTLKQAVAGYGLEMSAAAIDYNTRDIPERVAARQPSLLGFAGVVGCLAASAYLFANNFPLWQSGAIFCCALVTVVLEQARRKAA